ncbi:hypothetical protein HMPREF9065_01256, partial [Aggregatibacter sp. oral taxon 458 str. W10330]
NLVVHQDARYELLVIDVETEDSAPLLDKLRHIDGTIRTRILF